MRRFCGLLCSLFLLTACAEAGSSGPSLSVENAWARPANLAAMPAATAADGMDEADEMSSNDTAEMPGMGAGEASSAAYFLIVNAGDEADSLTGASSPVASQVGIHETRIENDLAQMLPVDRLEIPAHGQVEFKPGGYHVMLTGLTQDLKEGETIQITLEFEKSGKLTLDVPVRQQP